MWLVLLLLLLPGLSWAADVICGDTTRLYRYTPSIDATQAPACPAPYTQSTLSKATPPETVEAQRALVATPATHQGHTFPRLYPYYLKVVDGLMVEMTTQEKAAVDAVEQARLDALQTFRDEVQQQDVCSKATLDELRTLLAARKATKKQQLLTAKTNLQTSIDGIAAANLTTLRLGLTALNNTYYTVDDGLIDEVYLLVEKNALCLLARLKTRS